MFATKGVRLRRRAVATFAVVAASAGVAMADVYEIDKDHTEVRFTWDHVGMSRQGGRFRDVSGTLNFDPTNPGASTVDVRIKVASISTGVTKLDDQLVRSGEFFDAQAFPTISFRSTSVAPSIDRKAQVTGNLTINGVTKPVVLDVRWNFTGEHPLAPINPVYKETFSSGFSATTQILRSDFGISRTVPFVSDEVRISIESEFHRTKVTSPQAAGTPDASQAPPGSLPGPSVQPGRQGLSVPEPGTAPSPPPLSPSEGSAPHSAVPPAGPQPSSPSEPPIGQWSGPADNSLATPPPVQEDGPAPEPGPDPNALPPLDPSQRLDN